MSKVSCGTDKEPCLVQAALLNHRIDPGGYRCTHRAKGRKESAVVQGGGGRLFRLERGGDLGERQEHKRVLLATYCCRQSGGTSQRIPLGGTSTQILAFERTQISDKSRTRRLWTTGLLGYIKSFLGTTASFPRERGRGDGRRVTGRKWVYRLAVGIRVVK
ncbi:hypothetical protein KM043_010960 [Ampulex compressa]|nr:hypothetical protein KM043_010960 [Ampulex compressa]